MFLRILIKLLNLPLFWAFLFYSSLSNASLNLGIAVVSEKLNSFESSFGHTFIIFYSGSEPDVMSETVSYLADVDASSGGLSYLKKGIFGGFRGEYKVEPLISKLQHYLVKEGRQIEIYGVAFNSDEVDDLHDSLIQSSHVSSYRFFSNNCASNLGNALAPQGKSHVFLPTPTNLPSKLEDRITQKWIYSPPEYSQLNLDQTDLESQNVALTFQRDGTAPDNYAEIMLKRKSEFDINSRKIYPIIFSDSSLEIAFNTNQNALVNRFSLGLIDRGFNTHQKYTSNVSIKKIFKFTYQISNESDAENRASIDWFELGRYPTGPKSPFPISSLFKVSQTLNQNIWDFRGHLGFHIYRSDLLNLYFEGISLSKNCDSLCNFAGTTALLSYSDSLQIHANWATSIENSKEIHTFGEFSILLKPDSKIQWSLSSTFENDNSKLHLNSFLRF